MIPFLVVLIALVPILVRAEDKRPTNEGAVREAIERGTALRSRQSRLVPNGLQENIVILKVGGVRCGHARVSIEAAGGDGGDGGGGAAVYRLKEDFKFALARPGHEETNHYTGEYLLDAGAGLISATASARSTFKSPINSREQTMKATLALRENALEWEISEDGGEAKKGRMALHGVRPVPKNAVLLMAAFAAMEKNFKPEKAKPICIPTLELNWATDHGMPGTDLAAAWITFDKPEAGAPKGTALTLRLRNPVSEITAKGLEIEIPSPEIWDESEAWPLDGTQRRIQQAVPGDYEAQPIDPATFDPNVTLDLVKLGEIMKERLKK